ncbi:GVQW3 protein, partial [Acromyrmex heyeri]
LIMEQRAAIKFCFKLKKTPSETLELLQTAYGNECLSRSKVFEWYARFKAGRESLAENQDHVDNLDKLTPPGRGNRRLFSSDARLTESPMQVFVLVDLDIVGVADVSLPLACSRHTGHSSSAGR